MTVITFDFDNTIAMSHMVDDNDSVKYVFDGYNETIINKIKKHIANDDEVFIVTSRFEDKEGMFPEDTVKKHLEKLSLSYFFWPNRVYYTNGNLKQQKLVELGTTIHYDDDMEEHVAALEQEYIVRNPYDYYDDTELVGKVVIFDADDRILLLRRTDEGKKWDLPGGHIKDIEAKRGFQGLKQGTEREVAEETGLILPFLQEIAVELFTFNGENSKITFYLSKFDSNKPIVNLNMQQKQENDKYLWVSLDETYKYAKNGTQVLRKALEVTKKHGVLTEIERFQRAMKAKHKKMKIKLIGLGKNKHFGGGKGHKKPKMSRSKSAPAGFGGLEEENDKKKLKIKVKIIHNMDEKRKKRRKKRRKRRKKRAKYAYYGGYLPHKSDDFGSNGGDGGGGE